MRIKEIRCDRFAGLSDREYDFEKGMNLIIGDNESGKSTLVDLMYHLFFQNAAIDGRSDRDFKEKYFPKSTGAYQGDTIDGEIRFETEKGTYRLSKEWSGKNGTAKLKLPDGAVIRDENTIRSVLGEVLTYGKGVYDELVFASQRREQTLLSSLLGRETTDNMNELSATLTKAVMETGGIAVDEMETELKETVSCYEGRWDFAVGLPEGGRKRGIQNKWAIKEEKARILWAFYKMEEIAAAREKAEAAERSVDGISADIRAKKQELERLTFLRERFSKVRSQIAAQNANRALLGKEEESLRAMQSVLSVWPSQAAQLSKAKELRKRLQQAKLRESYETVHSLMTAQDTVRQKLDRMGTVVQADIEEGAALERAIVRYESALQGMNLTARIKQLGAADVRVTSAVSGEILAGGSDEINITEAVDICVPGVVEIRLAPKGVDADGVRSALTSAKEKIAALLERYSAGSVEQLRERQREAKDLAAENDRLEDRIRSALGGLTWEGLCAGASAVPENIPSVKETEREIVILCGAYPIDTFIGRLETRIDGYGKDFGTVDTLAAAIEKKSENIAGLKAKTEGAQSMPEEFRGISDADRYDEDLRIGIEYTRSRIDALKDDLSAAESGLMEKSAEEYAEDYRRAESAFEELKAEHARWKHILAVFQTVKNNAKGNPLADVETYFRENLSVLSQGRLVLNGIGEDLGSSIASGNSPLTADLLSDGTKDTVALAFRLAVLRHRCPEGGCTAVFDDPFTDMDPTRTEQACRLLQDFARNNQVIFISCDEKYNKYLTGNLIRITG